MRRGGWTLSAGDGTDCPRVDWEEHERSGPFSFFPRSTPFFQRSKGRERGSQSVYAKTDDQIE